MVSDETWAVLLAAADLIEPEGAWCRIHAARDARGKAVKAVSPDACSWCLLGAITRARVQAGFGFSVWTEALAAISATANNNASKWNDAPGRTQAEVVAALRSAAGAA